MSANDPGGETTTQGPWLRVSLAALPMILLVGFSTLVCTQATPDETRGELLNSTQWLTQPGKGQ